MESGIENIITPQIAQFLNSPDLPIFILDEELRIIFINTKLKKHFGKKNFLYRYIYDILQIDIDFLSKQLELSKHFVTGTDQIITFSDTLQFNLPEKWHLFFIKTTRFSGFLLIGEYPEFEEKFYIQSPYELFWDLILRLENKLHTILDTLPDAVFIHLTNGRIIDVNKTAEKLYKASRKDLLNMSIVDISGKGYTQEMAFEKIQEAVKKGTHEFFWMARSTDGREFPVEVRLRKITFEAKTYVIAIVTDWTQMKNLEDQLITMENKYSNIFKNSPLGILQINSNLVIVDNNAKSVEILELHETNLKGEKLDKLPLPFKFINNVKKIFEKKKNLIFQIKLKNSSKKIKHIRVYLSLDFSGKKDPNCIAILEDFTREHSALEKHLEAEKRYHSLIDNSLAGILIYDKEGNILFINKRMEELSGYTLQEIQGKKIWEFIHPEDRDMAFKYYRKRFEEDIKVPFYELRTIDKNENIHWVIVSGTPIRYMGKVAVLDNLIDITDMKKLESQLVHTQKMESMGRMVAGITHDFNNILAILKGYISLLKMMVGQNEEMKEHFEVIEKTMGNAENLIQDLLSFAKKKSSKKEIINLNQLIKEFHPLMKRTVGKNIHLELKLESQSAYIFGNKNQIEQIILNLVINAVDALENRDNPVISIRTDNFHLKNPMNTYFAQIPEGEYVRLIVKDNGHGIPGRIMEKIFDPFFTTKHQSKGTGMGLAITAGIVREHKAFLDVHTMTDKGTTFYIYFPLQKS